MQKDSIIFMLKSHGVDEEHLAMFHLKLRDKSFTVDDCDKLLIKLGYERLFIFDEEINTSNENTDEDFLDDMVNEFEDDSFSDYEIFHKKTTFDE